LALGFAHFAIAQETVTPLKTPTQEAKDAGFKDLNGNIRTVDDYIGKGKWVLVMIWASDCHICNEEVD